jgi:mono/diheme cytochrome c family protein
MKTRVELRISGLLLFAVFAASSACAGGDRRTSATADSATVLAAARSDSGAGYSVPPPAAVVDSAPPVVSIFFPHPATILAADSTAGQALYRQRGGCLTCHGLRGEGVSGMGSSLADTVWNRGNGSMALLYTVIRDGMSSPQTARGGMPGAGGRHTPTEIFQIAAYVYTIAHPGSTNRDASALPASAPAIATPPTDTTMRK